MYAFVQELLEKTEETETRRTKIEAEIEQLKKKVSTHAEKADEL